MADINDLKLAALNTLGYTTGLVGDREKAWLEALTSSTGDLDDLWIQYLEDLGYTTGTPNDRQMQAWGDLGYTGTWNDRAKQFWAAGGVFTSDDSLLTDLVAWWPLDEESGTRADLHGSFDLSDTNTVLYESGKQGNAALFDFNNDESLNRAYEADFNIGDANRTICGWAKLAGVSQNTAVIIGQQFNNTTFNWRIARDATNNAIAFEVRDSADTTTTRVTKAISLDTWFWYEAYHDADNDIISLDVNVSGSPTTTAFSGGTAAGTGRGLVLGGTANRHMTGAQDEVQFYNALITESMRNQLYNSGSGMAYPG